MEWNGNTSSRTKEDDLRVISPSRQEQYGGRPLRSLNPISLDAESARTLVDRLPDVKIYGRSVNNLGSVGVLSPQGWFPITANSAAVPIPGTLSLRGFQPLSFERDRTSQAISFALHLVLVTAVILGFSLAQRSVVMAPDQEITTPIKFTLYDPPPPPKVMPVAKVMGGGGGGGLHEPVPAIKGHPPVVVAKMPALAPQIIRVAQPKLAVEPSVPIKLEDNNRMTDLGLPHSQQVALASQGAGANSGFGFGMGGGLGQGHGNGAGAGSGGGTGGGLMSVGGGVSAPQVIHSVEPEFTDEARRANFQGDVAIALIVDSQGNPQNVRVTRHLGMGLDEKAIAAVKQYRFRPAVYQGHPVAVQMVIDLVFHLH